MHFIRQCNKLIRSKIIDIIAMTKCHSTYSALALCTNYFSRRKKWFSSFWLTLSMSFKYNSRGRTSDEGKAHTSKYKWRLRQCTQLRFSETQHAREKNRHRTTEALSLRCLLSRSDIRMNATGFSFYSAVRRMCMCVRARAEKDLSKYTKSTTMLRDN